MKYTEVLIFVLVVSLYSCSTREEKISEVAKNSIDAFFATNLNTFKTYLDSSSLLLTDSVFQSDTLKFASNYALTFLKDVEQPLDNSVISFFSRSVNDHFNDTLQVETRLQGNQYKVHLNNATLFKFLKYERDLCNKIGIRLYKLKSDAAAFVWLEDAINYDDLEAKYYLGLIYAGEDNNKAKEILEKVYNQGYTEAAIELSHIYGMTFNRNKAIDILKTEVAKGNTEAMTSLAEYYNAATPPPDAKPLTAFKLYKMAAEKGNASAMVSLGWCYEYGKYIISYTPKDSEWQEDYDSAFYWYQKGALLGNHLGMQAIARFYLEGNYIDQDTVKGLHWLNEAAKINKESGYFDLGDVYREGVGVKVNKLKALQYYRLAAKEGMRVAEMNVEELEKELKLQKK